MTIHNFPAALETKSAEVDPVAEVKAALQGLTEDITKKTAPVADLATRLDEIEAKLARPNLGGKTKAEDGDKSELEAKALNSWLKTGEVDAETKTLVVGTPSAGGYVTAPEYSSNIIKKVTELSPMRRLASVISIGAGEIYIPTLVSDAEGGWVTETGTRTEDEPVFGQVNIKANEHAVIVPVSRILLEDSLVDMQAFIADRVAVKFAQAEATAFVSGNGTNQPTGFLNTPASFEQVTADQDGSDLIDALIDLFYTLPSEYAQRGTWAMNRRTMGAIRKAADNTDKGNLWSDSLANGQPARFLGAPVAEFNDMEDLVSGDSPAGDTFPVAFGSFADAYTIVDRVGLSILRDDYTAASTGIVKFHARRRVGGKLVLPEAIVLLKGAAA
jgi:HK97 family phage major capsid protein